MLYLYYYVPDISVYHHIRRYIIMAKQKHLTLEERFKIQKFLDQTYSFKMIGSELERDCTTISKEVRNHIIYRKTGAPGRPYNACTHRFSCDYRLICKTCNSNSKHRFCKFCISCNYNCSDFIQEKCYKLYKAPYVCNGCDKLKTCTLEKHFYHATDAHTEYKEILSESRSGISLSEDEVKHLDSVLSPLIKRGQSINHICANNADSIMVSESTIYRLVDYNLLSARNIDLPRKVRYKSRKVKKQFKVDKSCRTNRTIKDFDAFTKKHPELPITQIDSVEGKKGGKVLLTIHFVNPELMLAFLRDTNDSQSVIDIINKLYFELRPDVFMELMPVLLGDNGSEFSNPRALEYDAQGNKRTSVFYCDPSAPYQKGSAEKNHEFIRCIIPKGQSLDFLTQEKVDLMMNHINSYSRRSLGNKCPYDVFEFMFGKDILNKLGCKKIPANEILLHPTLLS